MSEQGYRVPDVCKIIGISYRQLDYWARTGLVRPSIKDAQGSGTQRQYSFQDLVVLKVIKSLLDTGVSLQRVRKAVEYLHDMKKPASGVTLMSDGARIYEAASPEAVVDLLAGLGLTLARALVAADGRRLELVKRRPATFAIFLRHTRDSGRHRVVSGPA